MLSIKKAIIPAMHPNKFKSNVKLDDGIKKSGKINYNYSLINLDY